MKFTWLKADNSHPPTPQDNVRRRSGYIEKTLREISSFFVNGLFSEEIVSRGGLLQSIDPRMKIFTLGAFVIAVSLYSNIFIVLGAYFFTVLLAYFSRIGVKFFLLRVWLFIPLFSGIIAIPALFNVFVPGEPILDLITLKSEIVFGPIKIPETISITRQGVASASLFVMRVATCVSFVVLMTLTTKWPHILKSLTVFRVPEFFTFILSMTYRYIHLLLRQVEDVHLARKSRTIGREQGSAGRKWITSQIKFILKRSLGMSEQVYSAMVSRGFTYELKTADNFTIKTTDYIWMVFSILIIAITLGLNWT